MSFFTFKGLFGDLGSFFTCGEEALFVAADALVRVQTFEHELRSRYLRFLRIFGADVYSRKFVQ